MGTTSTEHYISIGGLKLRLLLDANKISTRVAQLANEIEETFPKGGAPNPRNVKQTPLFLAILNGSFVFMADLVRHFSRPFEISFVKLASYKGVRSTGMVTTLVGLDEQVTGRMVYVVEDIVDTGGTIRELCHYLNMFSPEKVYVVSLLVKESTPAGLVHFYGFKIPQCFVVGYGLDYDGWGRHLPALYCLVEE